MNFLKWWWKYYDVAGELTAVFVILAFVVLPMLFIVLVVVLLHLEGVAIAIILVILYGGLIVVVCKLAVEKTLRILTEYRHATPNNNDTPSANDGDRQTEVGEWTK